MRHVRRAPAGREPSARAPANGGPNSHMTHLSELKVTGQGRARPGSGVMGGAMAALGFRGSVTGSKSRAIGDAHAGERRW